MSISPTTAAKLADGIYNVQSENLLKLFLKKSVFSKKSSEKRSMQAEVGSRLVSTKDCFGLCAMGGEAYERDIFLIFRGSTSANYMADWVSNARIGVEISRTGLPVHIGFNSIFNSMQPEIKQFLSDHSAKASTIHCIGHSLGGAVATIAADWVKTNSSCTVKLYTFGAPKPGFEPFSRRISTKLGAGNIYRVFHSTDPVPMIPVYPFMHAPVPGKGIHIKSSEALLTAAAHGMGSYIKSVEEKTWLSAGCPPPPTAHEKLVEKWLKSDRSLNPFSANTWDWIGAGLEYVLKKIMRGTVAIIQAPFVGAFTLVDKIAWLLKKGIDLSEEVSSWVLRLMRKIMQVLGMIVVDSVEKLTRAFMGHILSRMIDRINQEAQRAIRNISNRL